MYKNNEKLLATLHHCSFAVGPKEVKFISVPVGYVAKADSFFHAPSTRMLGFFFFKSLLSRLCLFLSIFYTHLPSFSPSLSPTFGSLPSLYSLPR